MVLLTCEHRSWKSSHPTAPSAFRPAEEGREELDRLIEAGSVALCYTIRSRSSTVNGVAKDTRCLELQAHFDPAVVGCDGPVVSRHARMRSMQAAVQSLG